MSKVEYWVAAKVAETLSIFNNIVTIPKDMSMDIVEVIFFLYLLKKYSGHKLSR